MPSESHRVVLAQRAAETIHKKHHSVEPFCARSQGGTLRLSVQPSPLETSRPPRPLESLLERPHTGRSSGRKECASDQARQLCGLTVSRRSWAARGRLPKPFPARLTRLSEGGGGPDAPPQRRSPIVPVHGRSPVRHIDIAGRGQLRPPTGAGGRVFFFVVTNVCTPP